MLIVIFNGTRYSVGTDYNNYKIIYHAISSYEENTLVEEGYYLINKVFSGIQDGFSYVIFLCTLIFYLIIYIVYYRENSLLLSLTFLFSFGLTFMANNLVRQSLAIAIFLLGLRYIYERRLFYFCLVILIGFFFHKSILYLFPFYWLANFNYSKFQLLSFFLISIIFSKFNFLVDVIYSLIKYVPKYSGYLEHSEAFFNNEVGFSLYLHIILYLILFYFYDTFSTGNLQNRILLNLVLIGICLSNILLSSPVLNRVSIYFFAVMTVLIPKIILHVNGNLQRKLVFTLFFTFSLVWWIKTFYFNDHTLLPYKSYVIP